VVLNPFTGEIVPFSYADLIANALGAIYDSFVWPSFAAFLALIDANATPAVLGAQLAHVHEELGLITKRGFPRYSSRNVVSHDTGYEQDIVPFTLPLTSTASAFEIEARRQVRGSLISEMLRRATP
jgi:hypothetical protein